EHVLVGDRVGRVGAGDGQVEGLERRADLAALVEDHGLEQGGATGARLDAAQQAQLPVGDSEVGGLGGEDAPVQAQGGGVGGGALGVGDAAAGLVELVVVAVQRS